MVRNALLLLALTGLQPSTHPGNAETAGAVDELTKQNHADLWVLQALTHKQPQSDIRGPPPPARPIPRLRQDPRTSPTARTTSDARAPSMTTTSRLGLRRNPTPRRHVLNLHSGSDRPFYRTK